MSFESLFTLVERASFESIDSQMVQLLQRTWEKISVSVCESRTRTRSARRRLPEGTVSVDDVRSAVYVNIFMWQGTNRQKVLAEWCERTVTKQNQLLIEAFPDGQEYKA